MSIICYLWAYITNRYSRECVHIVSLRRIMGIICVYNVIFCCCLHNILMEQSKILSFLLLTKYVRAIKIFKHHFKEFNNNPTTLNSPAPLSDASSTTSTVKWRTLSPRISLCYICGACKMLDIKNSSQKKSRNHWLMLINIK